MRGTRRQPDGARGPLCSGPPASRRGRGHTPSPLGAGVLVLQHRPSVWDRRLAESAAGPGAVRRGRGLCPRGLGATGPGRRVWAGGPAPRPRPLQAASPPSRADRGENEHQQQWALFCHLSGNRRSPARTPEREAVIYGRRVGVWHHMVGFILPGRPQRPLSPPTPPPTSGTQRPADRVAGPARALGTPHRLLPGLAHIFFFSRS